MTTIVEGVAVGYEDYGSPGFTQGGFCAGTMHHIRRSMRHIQSLTWKQLAYCVFCVLLVLFGAAGQVVVLNLWLHGFPSSANAPFTVLILSCLTSLVIYAGALFVWWIVYRPSFRFLLSWRALLLELADGGTGAIQGILIVSATQYTPELLQAFLLSTIIIWTFLFMKIVFKEARSYCSPLVIASFTLSLGGLLVGSASKFGDSGMSANAAGWTIVFAISEIPAALNGVVAAKFMRHFTLTDDQLAARQAAQNSPSQFQLQHAPQPAYGVHSALLGNTNTSMDIDRQGTDSGTAKGVRMLCSTLIQTVLVILLIPTSAIPWFGSYKTVGESITGLSQGVKCTFNLLPGCDDAFGYFMIFSACFAAYNVGLAILNYYSPAMTSMVSQLVSPLTAVILMAFPAWNVAGTTFNVPESICAVILIAIGAVLYTIWEESTGHASPDPAGSPTIPEKAPHTPR